MRRLWIFLPLLAAARTAAAGPLRNLEAGAKALAFSLEDGQGKTYALEAYAGKPVVLCYYRPGQSLSENALAAAARAHKRLSGAGAVFLALHQPDEEGAAAPPALPFPDLTDSGRQFYGAYGLFVLPTTLVLDREHRLKAAFSSFQRGLGDELEAALEEVLGLPPRRPAPAAVAAGKVRPPAVNLARRMLEERLPEQALESLKEALSAPGCEPRLVAAEALLRLSRLEEARRRAEECLEVEPASAHAALLEGRALALQGESARAEEWLKKAAALNPEPARARFYLGELYEKTGRRDEAVKEYRAALERVFSR